MVSHSLLADFWVNLKVVEEANGFPANCADLSEISFMTAFQRLQTPYRNKKGSCTATKASSIPRSLLALFLRLQGGQTPNCNCIVSARAI